MCRPSSPPARRNRTAAALSGTKRPPSSLIPCAMACAAGDMLGAVPCALIVHVVSSFCFPPSQSAFGSPQRTRERLKIFSRCFCRRSIFIIEMYSCQREVKKRYALSKKNCLDERFRVIMPQHTVPQRLHGLDPRHAVWKVRSVKIPSKSDRLFAAQREKVLDVPQEVVHPGFPRVVQKGGAQRSRRPRRPDPGPRKIGCPSGCADCYRARERWNAWPGTAFGPFLPPPKRAVHSHGIHPPRCGSVPASRTTSRPNGVSPLGCATPAAVPDLAGGVPGERDRFDAALLEPGYTLEPAAKRRAALHGKNCAALFRPRRLLKILLIPADFELIAVQGLLTQELPIHLFKVARRPPPRAARRESMQQNTEAKGGMLRHALSRGARSLSQRSFFCFQHSAMVSQCRSK